MKLSDAILLGSTMKAQGFWALFEDDRTCAMGAAYDAIGILDDVLESRNYTERMAVVAPHFPLIASSNQNYECPSKGCELARISVGGLAAHLNDLHKWTRERIAAWVATVEPQDTDHEFTDGGQVTRHGQSSETCLVDEKVISDAL